MITPGENSQLATVEIDDSEFDARVEVSNLHENLSTEYGPTLNENLPHAKSEQTSARKVLGLTFLPAGNLSVGYLGFLKGLEKHRINPNILVCPELAALVCVLYGKYKDLNRVEWELFDFYSKLEGYEFLGTDWQDAFSDLMKKEFKNERLEQLKVVVGIPVKSNMNKIKIYSKGLIVEIMEINLNVSAQYPGSVILDKQMDYSKFLSGRGADVISSISIQPGKKVLKLNNGFLFGIYSKLFYSSKSMLDENDFLIEIDREIDSKENILGVSNMVLEKSDDGLERLKERMVH